MLGAMDSHLRTGSPPMARAGASKFFGWRVVAGAFVLAIFGWGIGFYGPPVFLHSVVERTGWSVALVSSAVTFHFLAGAVVVANLPRLYLRLGLPLTTSLGAVALALGILGWAEAGTPWQLFLAAFFSGIGWVSMGAAAVNAIVAPWFVRTRPAALMMAYNGASIGGIVFSPLWVALIARLGFVEAALLVGLIMLAAIWLLSYLVFSRTPDSLGQMPDGEGSDKPAARVAAKFVQPLPGKLLWRDRRFLTLAAGMVLGLFAQVGLIAHLFSLLVPALGAQSAGLAMGMATAFAIVGRSLVGWLMPIHADRRLVASASYGVQILGSLVFILAAGNNIPLLLLGVALFGAGIGNATSMPPLIAQVEFAKEDVQRVVSQIVACAQASYAFAPALFGAIRALAPAVPAAMPEHTTLFFIVAAAIQLAAVASFMLGQDRVSFSQADP
jgi:MFS family permease